MPENNQTPPNKPDDTIKITPNRKEEMIVPPTTHTFQSGKKMDNDPHTLTLKYTQDKLKTLIKGLVLVLKVAEDAKDDDIEINLHGKVTVTDEPKDTKVFSVGNKGDQELYLALRLGCIPGLLEDMVEGAKRAAESQEGGMVVVLPGSFTNPTKQMIFRAKATYAERDKNN